MKSLLMLRSHGDAESQTPPTPTPNATNAISLAIPPLLHRSFSLMKVLLAVITHISTRPQPPKISHRTHLHAPHPLPTPQHPQHPLPLRFPIPVPVPVVSLRRVSVSVSVSPRNSGSALVFIIVFAIIACWRSRILMGRSSRAKNASGPSRWPEGDSKIVSATMRSLGSRQEE